MQKQRRVKQTKSLQHRLSNFLNGERDEGESSPASADRNELLKKVRQPETAWKIERWANSPELQPPK